MSRSSHGKPTSAPAGFILPCRPTVAARPPRSPGWVHELKHDGYRLQIHVRDGRVRLYTMNGNDWTRRYPRADFDALHSRTADENAVALAFDLLFAGDDIRRRPLIERKKELKWVLRNARDGVQYVEHTEGDGAEMFAAVCKLGLEGIVSKRLTSGYKSGPSKTWIKIKNPNSPAATRVLEGGF